MINNNLIDEMQALFNSCPFTITINLDEVEEQLNTIKEQLESLNLKIELDLDKSIEQNIIDIFIAFADILNAGSTLVTFFGTKKKLGQLTDSFKSGKEPAQKYNNELNKLANNLERISPKVKEISKALEPMAKDMEKAGKAISEGLIKGITSMDDDTRKAMIKVTAEIVKGVKEELQINSPSKVMERLGNYISEGLADGIKEGGRFVEDASKQLCDGCEEQFKDLEKATDKLNGKKISFGGGLAILAGVATTVIGLFQNLMENNEEFSEKMQEVWALVQEAFQPVVDAFTALN